MFWFDRKDPERATFCGQAPERRTLPDVSEQGRFAGTCDCPRPLADFTDLPFPTTRLRWLCLTRRTSKRNGATGWGLSSGRHAER